MPFCKGYKDDSTLGNAFQDTYDDYQIDCSKAVGYLSVYR